MRSFNNSKNLFSFNNMYPDRSNLNYVGPSYYEFTSKNKLHDDFGHSYLRNHD